MVRRILSSELGDYGNQSVAPLKIAQPFAQVDHAPQHFSEFLLLLIET